MSGRQRASGAWPSHARPVIGVTLALALLGGALAAAAGIPGLALLLAIAVFLAVAVRPEAGAYLYLAVSPLVAGIARGEAIPLLRPNEALLLLLVAALATRILVDALTGTRYRPAIGRVDVALVLLAAAGSILPLLVRSARGQPISFDDIMYAMVLWKYFLLYRIFRDAITTPRQVAICLGLAMASAAMVAVIALLQVAGLLGVPGLLQAYYDQPFSGNEALVTDRGTSTVASSFGVADIMTMNLAVAIAWLVRGAPRARATLIALGGLFLLGAFASGQFSGLIGLAVAVLAVGFVTGRLARLMTIAIPTALVASLLLAPVIVTRLQGFETPSGLPQSWVGRLDNLERFVWPVLSVDGNWLLGVRPAARIPAPETWRDWVFIESGYVWLLWSGGLPMVAAFAYFAWVALQDLASCARRRADAIGVAATGAFAALVTMITLMLFDPHLTMRGSADLFFPLLALSLVAASPRPRPRAQPDHDAPRQPARPSPPHPG